MFDDSKGGNQNPYVIKTSLLLIYNTYSICVAEHIIKSWTVFHIYLHPYHFRSPFQGTSFIFS